MSPTSAKTEGIPVTMSTSTADPSGWKMTTVRWLSTHYPEYGGPVNKTAHERLMVAMRRMSYMTAEAQAEVRRLGPTLAGLTTVINEEQRLRGGLLKAWGEQQHTDLQGFLAAGGHAAREEELAAGEGALTMTDESGAPVEGEFVVSESSGPGGQKNKPLSVKSSRPAAPVIIEQDMDDVLAAEEMGRAGHAW